MRYSPALLVLIGFLFPFALSAEPPQELQLQLDQLPQESPDIQDAPQIGQDLVSGKVLEDGGRHWFLREAVLGKKVVVEGLAWGQPFGLKGQQGTISPHVLPHVIH